MSDQENDTSYNTFNNTSEKVLSNPSSENYLIPCCCVTNKWYFNHIGLASMKEYDNTVNNYCVCLDCCTWCLEFQTRKYAVCEKPIICYLCCCSIYFIE